MRGIRVVAVGLLIAGALLARSAADLPPGEFPDIPRLLAAAATGQADVRGVPPLALAGLALGVGLLTSVLLDAVLDLALGLLGWAGRELRARRHEAQVARSSARAGVVNLSGAWVQKSGPESSMRSARGPCSDMQTMRATAEQRR